MMNTGSVETTEDVFLNFTYVMEKTTVGMGQMKITDPAEDAISKNQKD